MAGATTDIPAYPYGPEGQLTSYPVGATQTVYPGCVALVSAGSGASAGNLKNAATPAATDLVAGLIATPAGGTYVQTGPGITGGSTDGAVWVDVQAGTFMIQSGTGADLLTTANN